MKFSKTFENAAKGLLYCLKNERNMRIHLVTAVYVVLFSFFFGISKTEKVLVFSVISLVVSAEMFNTAIERIVDLIVSDYNSVIKIIKDIAAGAVFAVTIFAAAIGSFLFFRLKYLIKIYDFFTNNLILFIVFLISLYMSLSFIINGKFKLKIIKLRKK